MSDIQENKKIAWLFCTFGGVAIITGGIFAAFSAAAPSQIALWMSAYLVLVVGAIQIGIGVGLSRLAVTVLPRWWQLALFLLFNIGNAAVITGTIIKGSAPYSNLVVDCGSLVLAVSLVACLVFIRGAAKSWWRTGYIALIVMTLLSSGVGVVLARLL